MPDSQNLIGQRIGSYEIVSRLGKGGMAEVFRARQLLSGGVSREVALKLIDARLSEMPEFNARFNREAQTLVSLSHAHILKAFDYGLYQDSAYLVMELMAGGSLAELVRKGPLPYPQVVKYIDQIGSALDYAHKRGVIHRDLKPQNVLLDESGDAFLTDFGIVKLMGDSTTLTQSHTVIGTPSYMSPEQATGSAIDSRSDLYALGVMTFELLSGKLPFTADTPVQVLFKHAYEPPPRVTLLRADAPPALDQLVAKAIAKSPEDRYQKAEELTADLRTALSNQPVSAPSIAARTSSQPTAGAATEIVSAPNEALKDTIQPGGDVEISSHDKQSERLNGNAEHPSPPKSVTKQASAQLNVLPGKKRNVSCSVIVSVATVVAALVFIVILSIPSPFAGLTGPSWTPLKATGIPTTPSITAIVVIPPVSTVTSSPSATLTSTVTAAAASSPVNTQTKVDQTYTAQAVDVTASYTKTLTPTPSTTFTPTVTASITFTPNRIPLVILTPSSTQTVTLPPSNTSTSTPTATLTLTVTPTTANTVINSSSTATAPPLLNSWLNVPAGCFIIGSTQGYLDEQPTIPVCVNMYKIQKYVVSWDALRQCVNSKKCNAPTDAHYTDPAAGQYPATGVTWLDARDYCEWIGADLPTEAQWEYAAKGNNNWLFPWGSSPPATNQAIFSSQAPQPIDAAPDGISWVGATSYRTVRW